jgi:hypothetical protein
MEGLGVTCASQARDGVSQLFSICVSLVGWFLISAKSFLKLRRWPKQPRVGCPGISLLGFSCAQRYNQKREPRTHPASLCQKWSP